MKVLQIANGYLGNRLYENLFAALRSRGVENTVYVPLNRKNPPPPEENSVIFSRCFADLDRILFFPKQKKLLQDITSRNLCQGVSIIHAHTIFSGGYAALQLHKRYHLPYIVALRNTDLNVFFKYMIHLRKTGVEIMRQAEHVIFLSPSYRDQVLTEYIPAEFREELTQKSVVIPNGIAPLFFQDSPLPKKPPKENLRLIYVGEVSSNKNLETSIEAVKLLRRQGITVSLMVVGSIVEEKYHSMLRDHADFVIYRDRCPQTEVIMYLRQADIFVMPSHTESFGLVYAEAMSQGLPVLYTRGQGFDGQFSDGTVGYAVSDRDPEELAEAVRKILARYREISENCLGLVGKFDWGRIAEQYQTIYQEHGKGLKS